MADIITAKNSRKSRKGAITRERNNINVLMAEEDVEKVEEHLKTLKEKLRAFEESHDIYHAFLTEEAEVEESDEYLYTVQQEYITAVKDIRTWIKQAKCEAPKIKPAVNISPPETSTSDLRRTSTKASSSSSQVTDESPKEEERCSTLSSELISFLHLPKIELEPFDGDPVKYHSFFAIFDETVHSINPDGKVRLTRLLQYTSGPAREAIRSCALIGGTEGYAKARRILQERFGNDHLISQKIIESFRCGKSIKSPIEFLQFADELSNGYMILERMGKLNEVSSQSCILDVINRFEPFIRNRWRRLVMDSKHSRNVYLSFRDLVDFISLQASEANDPVYGRKSSQPKVQENAGKRSSTSYTTSVDSLVRRPVAPSVDTNTRRPVKPCVLCKQDHRLFYCEIFKKMKPVERLDLVKLHKLCHNCLLDNHEVSTCRRSTVCTVPGCGRKHTKFIHVDNEVTGEVGSNIAVSNQVQLTSMNANQRGNIQIPVVPVVVNESFPTFALLDTASTCSFCTKKLVVALKLRGFVTEVKLTTLSNDSDTRFSEVVAFVLKSKDGANSIRLSNVYVVDRIPVNNSDFDTRCYKHLSDLPLSCGTDVDILIGQDNSEALIPLEVRRGSKGDPFAIRTLLGWSINGPVSVNGPVSGEVISHFIVDSSLEQKVENLWKVENDGLHVDELSFSQEDVEVLEFWDKNTKLIDGHYEIPIPWKDDIHVPNNVSVAKSRLFSLKASLERDSLFSRYNSEIHKMLERGYAEVVPLEESVGGDRVWYLPHRAVITEKKPGKVRIVFDCAARYMSESLNDKAKQGPDLNNRLLNVLLRFRQHSIALTADIESMYNQVKVPVGDRNMLRFLWFDADGRIVHYRMTSHLFGGVWCSSLATYALKRTVRDNPDLDPELIDTVNNAFYVDDCLKSFPCVEEAIQTVHGLRSLSELSGFKVTKFVTNNETVLAEIPESDRAPDAKGLNHGVISKTLGVQWDVNPDEFYFFVHPPTNDLVTKRTMLSFISSMFDPLGLVNPMFITGKILFQEATRRKLDWDSPVTGDLLNRWVQWIRNLGELADFRIPRCIKSIECDDGYHELHNFSDASSKAFGCCSYLRSVNRHGTINVALVMSKAKIAPLKMLTIPRLELEAAVLSAKIDSLLRRELNIHLCSSYFWVDSQIVLAYIKNEDKRFHVYVGNRISAIRDLTTPEQWNFISGSENPADLVTRDQTLRDLDAEKWLRGAEFLRSPKSEWNRFGCDVHVSENDPEVKSDVKDDSPKAKSFIVDVENHPIDQFIEHYSSWSRVKRAVAWWLRLLDVLRNKSHPGLPQLTLSELRNAEVVIVKHVQKQVYPREFDHLSSDKSVSKSSPLRSLCPLIDSQGLLCVGGRLKHGDLPSETKHPRIIPHRHRAAELICLEFHGRAHLGVEWVLSELRTKYWVTNARSLLKKLGRKCLTCKRFFASGCTQKMADLPPERLEPGRPPFSYVGLDCFGPFYVKCGRCEVKRYVCLFTCLCTRAIHLEVLEFLDTDAFLNGLRRFVSRRGFPVKIWSDNGTNFVGAHSELKKCLKELNQSRIQGYCLQAEIDWHFNPPHASHMGGMWERLIRTVRKVLIGILGKARLTDEVLRTVLCEAENIVNGRPITRVSDDVNDLSALTPNHLLLLREGPPPPPGSFDKADGYRKRWKHSQFLAGQFWKQWLKQYLPELQKRQKWLDKSRNLKISDLVLVMDENVPRWLWPLGSVVDVKCGRDGLVRTVHVKTKSSVLVRPVTKIVLLEGDD